MRNLVGKERLFLHYIAGLDKSNVKHIFKTLTKSQVQVISGIVYNGLMKTSEIKSADVNGLRKHKSALYLIANKRTGFIRKRKLITTRFREILLLVKAALKWIPIKTPLK